MSSVSGRLALQFEYDHHSARTALQVNEQRQPLKVVRAFCSDDGSALVHIHNVSGGVLAGDRLSIDLDVCPKAAAQVTSTGATRVYRCRSEAQAAASSIRVRVAAGGLLEYLPDPLIPFAGSRYEQRTTIDLDEGAGLFWWETVAPGREARGETFAYDALRLRFELRAGGIPISLESSDLVPAVRPLSSLARLGPYLYWSSFHICRATADASTWPALEKRLLPLAGELSSPVIIWGLGRLPAHGLVVRALSLNGRDIARGLIAFWRAAKQALYGRDAVIPRKIY
ncbi:MAG TPA: urease accessory protein UreD [Bryobacteraceae bacterium]|nr:urease accessory protein UreD [Bryobacteraceae bacterium]